jgi:phosphoribosyl 1,2-cyclic phosphodiesterase
MAVLELRPAGLYCPAGDFYIDPWRPVDRAVLTHAHADHMHGIDELRSVNHAIQAPLPCYGDASTLADAKRRFGSAFGTMAYLPDRRHFVVPVLQEKLLFWRVLNLLGLKKTPNITKLQKRELTYNQ